MVFEFRKMLFDLCYSSATCMSNFVLRYHRTGRLLKTLEEVGIRLDYTIIRQRGLLNVDEVDYELTRKGEPENGSVIFSKKHYNIY